MLQDVYALYFHASLRVQRMATILKHSYVGGKMQAWESLFHTHTKMFKGQILIDFDVEGDTYYKKSPSVRRVVSQIVQLISCKIIMGYFFQ